MKTLNDYLEKLNTLNFKDMYNNDFLLTWEKSDDELEALFTIADALRFLKFSAGMLAAIVENQ